MDLEGDLQLGPWGLGTAIALQQYGLSRDNGASTGASNQRIQAQFAVGLLHLARNFVRGQLLFGAGLRYTGFSVLNQNTQTYNSQTLFTTQGVGYEFGWLWRPYGQMFRLGASVRSAVTTKAELGSNIAADASGNRTLFSNTADQMYVPNEVALPWEWSLGFAVQLGSRPFNPRWVDPYDIVADVRQTVRCNELERERRQQQLLSAIPKDAPDRRQQEARILAELKLEHDKDQQLLEQAAAGARRVLKERERALGRWYLLMATSLKVSGPVDNAVGVESFPAAGRGPLG